VAIQTALPPGEPPAGKIALLEDRNGDGVYETRTTYAEGLTFPNGVLPWKGGAFRDVREQQNLSDVRGVGETDDTARVGRLGRALSFGVSGVAHVILA
jgi:hypothetical protein